MLWTATSRPGCSKHVAYVTQGWFHSPVFYSSLCKHGPARQNFGASASGVQLGRAGIVARRLVRVKETVINRLSGSLVDTTSVQISFF